MTLSGDKDDDSAGTGCSSNMQQLLVYGQLQENKGGAWEGGGEQFVQELTAMNGADADSCGGRAAIGNTMSTSHIGLAAMPTEQSWQWPSCSRLAWLPGAGFAPGPAMLFVPELVQISAVSSLLFSWEAASAVSTILNRTTNSTVQASANWNLPWRNMTAFYRRRYVSFSQ